MTNKQMTSGVAASGIFTIGGDLTVNRLGFGAMRITGKGIMGPPPDREAAKDLLRRVVAAGINFIDTADSYGPNESEELIAEALYPYPSDLVIATKGGFLRPGPNEWTPDGRPEHLRDAIEGSLRRLRLERIDVYQQHRPDPKVPYESPIALWPTYSAPGRFGTSAFRTSSCSNCLPPAPSRRSFRCRIATTMRTVRRKKSSNFANATASPSCHDGRRSAVFRNYNDELSRKSRARTKPPYRRSRWHGCLGGRRSCFRFRVPRPFATSRKTSPLRRSISATRSMRR